MPYEMLEAPVGVTVERIAVWEAYSADGSEPSSGLIVDHSGDAAYWNGSGLPAGWAKEGTGGFADA